MGTRAFFQGFFGLIEGVSALFWRSLFNKRAKAAASMSDIAYRIVCVYLIVGRQGAEIVLWIVIGVIVVFAIIFSVTTTKTKTQSPVACKTRTGLFPSPVAYRRSTGLFSPAERSFLGVLEQAVGEQYRVFGKVRLADVVLPRRGLPRSEWQKAFNRISSKHLDFVLCKKGDLSVVCEIELNDKSHQQTKRRNRDQFLKQALHTADVPLVMFPAKSGYAVPEVRSQIAKAVATEPTESLSALPNEDVSDVKDENKVCPKCSSPMVRRKAAKGAHAGKEFWGCSNYPKCKAILPV